MALKEPVATELPAAPSTSVHAEARRQKTALLYRNAGAAFVVNIVNGALLAYVSSTAQSQFTAVFIWWCATTAIATERYVLARKFHATVVDANASALWRVRYIAATTLAAIAWGSCTVLFMWDAPDGVRLFIGLVLAGMVAGAVPLLAAVPVAFNIFASMLIAPMAVTIFLQASSPLHWAFGSMAVVFLAAMVSSARYLHETIDSAIQLGLEKSQIVDNLVSLSGATAAALTERNQALATLQVSEERLRLAFQTVRQAWFDYDLLTGKVSTGPEFLRMLEEQDAKPFANELPSWLDLVHVDDRATVSECVRNCITHGGPVTVEYRRQTNSGHWIWLRTVGKVIQRDASGQATRIIGIHTDITEQKLTQNKIQELAYFDQLTGLPNRTLLQDRLRHAIAASSRSAKCGALILIDLDNFKDLNDAYGYNVGDLLLKQVAQRVRDSVRDGDTVARIGSDEFVVILENINEGIQDAVAETEAMGGKIIHALRQKYPLEIGDHTCTASLGVTIFVDQSTSVDDLLKRADIAMHQSKSAGRNTLRFFDPGMQAIVEKRSQLEQDLRAAVSGEQFVLHYQPQFGRDGRLVGAEVLVRWQHPTHGLVSPAQFIPFSEENGLIEPIGQWVLHNACRQLAIWNQRPQTRALVVAVNVSAVQFRNRDFVNQVVEALQSTGADPRYLKLELTESLLVTDVDVIIEKMIALRNFGVSFALDDFGTGYSSLSYLSRLPLDQLKIDRSFVDRIESSTESAAICAAIINLAHTLKLKVVAEGVETEAQHYFLNTVHRCDQFQGYLFSHPLPVGEFEVFHRVHTNKRLENVA